MHDFDEYLRRFVNGYCECLLWADTEVWDGTDEPRDDRETADPAWWQSPRANWPLEAFPHEDRDRITEQCDDFAQAQWLPLLMSGLEPERAGHDFLLTRNRHGAGFWDRGLGVVGRILTDAAHVYGSTSAYTYSFAVSIDDGADEFAHLQEW